MFETKGYVEKERARFESVSSPFPLHALEKHLALPHLKVHLCEMGTIGVYSSRGGVVKLLCPMVTKPY